MSDIVKSWTVTDHGVAEPAEVERAIVLLGADDAALAYRVQGYIATQAAEITRLRGLVEGARKVVAYYANSANYASRKTLAPAVIYERGDLARRLLDKLAEADPTRWTP